MLIPNEFAAKFGAMAPTVAAVLLLLLSPLLNSKVKRIVIGQIAEAETSFGVSSATPIPPHLSRGPLTDFVDYTADAAQVVPATFLPIVGAIFALSSDIERGAAVAALVVACLAALALDAYVLTQSAAVYVSRKRMGYSIVTACAIGANLLNLAIVFFQG